MKESAYRGVSGKKFGKPHPEFVVPGSWKIRPTEKGGRVDLNGYVMEVPVDGSVNSRLTRTHEMAHTAFTPEGQIGELFSGVMGRRPNGLEEQMLQITEDLRVNHLSLRHAFRPGLSEEGRREYRGNVRRAYRRAFTSIPDEQAEKAIDPLTAMLGHFTCLPFFTGADNVELTPEPLRGLMGMAMRIGAGLMAEPTFSQTVRAACDLAELIPRDTRDDLARELARMHKAPPMRGDDEVEEVSPEECEPGDVPYRWKGEFAQLPGDVKEVIKGIEMEVVHIKMPNRKRVGFGVDRHYLDVGTVPKYVARFGWGPVFNEKVIGCAGGSMLIDDSGSMSLSAEEMWGLLEEAPLATVAAYNGSTHRKFGRLRVLARGGKFCERKDIEVGSVGSANLVDLQALQWLACQPKPRVWVSDGGITGLGDHCYRQLTAYCRDHIGEPADIMRLENIDTAIALFGLRHRFRMHRGMVRKMFGFKQGKHWRS